MKNLKKVPVEITDAIGQPLSVGDFVTAVWANATVELFEIAGFGFKGSNWRRGGENVAMLRRKFEGHCKEETQTKLVKKPSKMLTKVSTEAVMHYMLTT